jgi:hypothetical protein
MIRYGVKIFMLLLAFGTLFMLVNHTMIEYNSYYEFIAQTIIKNCFVLLAEAVIGALAFDYVFRRNG